MRLSRPSSRIILRTPQDPLPRVGIGRTYFEVRDDAAAQENFQQAVELVCQECPLYSGDDYLRGEVPSNRDLPEYIFMPAWTRLGQVYLTRRNYEDVVGIMEEAIAWSNSQDRDDPDFQEIPIEAYYVAATAYYYIDKDEAGNPMCDRRQLNWSIQHCASGSANVWKTPSRWIISSAYTSFAGITRILKQHLKSFFPTAMRSHVSSSPLTPMLMTPVPPMPGTGKMSKTPMPRTQRVRPHGYPDWR